MKVALNFLYILSLENISIIFVLYILSHENIPPYSRSFKNSAVPKVLDSHLLSFQKAVKSLTAHNVCPKIVMSRNMGYFGFQAGSRNDL